jgi:hypothetical protein
MLTAVTTGLRVAELIALRIGDVTTSPTGHIRVLGKRRKNRTTPLKAETATVLSDWLHERQGDPNDPVFPTRQGRALSQDAVTKLLAKHTSTAADHCPSLAGKRVTPHILRHTNPMLLQAEHVDIATIALWLGHESIKTTYIYQHANQDFKQEAIDRTATIGTPPGRYQPPTRSSRSSTPSRLSRPANHPDPHRSREDNAVNRPSRDNRKVGIKPGPTGATDRALIAYANARPCTAVNRLRRRSCGPTAE